MLNLSDQRQVTSRDSKIMQNHQVSDAGPNVPGVLRVMAIIGYQSAQTQPAQQLNQLNYA